MFKKIRNNLKKYKAKDFFLIYQMGKVGSSAIESSLSNSVNIHTLYNNHPCPYNHSIGYLGLYKWFSEKLYCRVKKLIFLFRKETKIITIYRAPLERNISMFMQDYCFWYASAMKNGVINGKMEGSDLPAKIFKSEFDHLYPFNWFEKELKQLTGFNVFDFKDNLQQHGFLIKKQGKFKILVINYNYLDSVFDESEVVDFIGKKISLANTNSAGDKWYSSVYKSLKDELVYEEMELYSSESKLSIHPYYELLKK